MPLEGEYAPSSAQWVRDQVQEIESSGGTEGTVLRGVPVIVITSMGRGVRQAAQEPGDAGRARRQVRGGRLQGRRPRAPRLVPQPRRAPVGRGPGRPGPRATSPLARSTATSGCSGGRAPWRSGPTMTSTRPRPTARSPSSCSSPPANPCGPGWAGPAWARPPACGSAAATARRPARAPRRAAELQQPVQRPGVLVDVRARVAAAGDEVGTVSIRSSAGSTSATSSQASGVETRASGVGRTL